MPFVGELRPGINSLTLTLKYKALCISLNRQAVLLTRDHLIKTFVMNTKSEVIMQNQSIVLNAIGWLFGITFLLVGFINTFWGNDPGFGVFIILLSFVYFPPVNILLKEKFGFSIPVIAKILLALFIIWAAIGVGELPAKIEIMMKDLG
jgi:hypothetical protein